MLVLGVLTPDETSHRRGFFLSDFLPNFNLSPKQIPMKRIITLLVSLLAGSTALAQTEFQILYGPYLQMVGENEATVMWVTSGDAVSWVETAPNDGSHFYAVERERFYESRFGRKEVGKLHKVRITGLEPGTSYRYRIYSREVTSLSPYYVQYGAVRASNVYREQPYRFTTLDKNKSTLSFRVVNDIHENPQLLESLLKVPLEDNPDFVFFNGDMLTTMDSEKQIFEGFMNKAIEMFAAETPLFLSRGNHEARGNFSPEYIRYFPTSTGDPYYLFKAGPAAILVIDGGEDKPDSDIEYWGLADFDRYREEQARWIAEAVASPTFRDAPYRIVMLHVPPAQGSSPWHGSIHLQKHFLPILNRAGIDLMVCAHLHRHFFHPAGTDQEVDFPVLINSNRDVVDIEVTGNMLEVLVRNAEQKQVGKWSFPRK